MLSTLGENSRWHRSQQWSSRMIVHAPPEDGGALRMDQRIKLMRPSDVRSFGKSRTVNARPELRFTCVLTVPYDDLDGFSDTFYHAFPHVTCCTPAGMLCVSL